LAPVLRAVLTSAEAKPALAQVTMGPHEGESTVFPKMVEVLHEAYGRSGMIDIIDADAGLISLANADFVDRLGYGYVFGIRLPRWPHGSVETEDRYFVSSLLWSYLKPAQILLLVRGHWGIEDDAYNSLDQQWLEDSGPWCTQGNAVWALGLLRLMAYNLVQYLRKRRLRRKTKTGAWMSPMCWRTVFDLIRQALENAAPVPQQDCSGV
jgi:hypothetical protein